MKQFSSLLFIIIVFILESCDNNNTTPFVSSLRAPAYPLIAIDPYTNDWSTANNLYDATVVHSGGKVFPLIGAIRVDDETYRFMGEDNLRKIPIAGTALYTPWTGKYTFEMPGTGWETPDFSDEKWENGEASFGFMAYENLIKTRWQSKNIWVRRHITLDNDLHPQQNIYLEYSNDDDVEIYINGIEVFKSGNLRYNNASLLLPEHVVKTLKKGDNVIAAHCMNRQGYTYLDFGLMQDPAGVCRMQKTAKQKNVTVLPTQTIYTFTCGKVDLKLTFTSPLLMNNLELLSRPVNYISYEIASNDSKPHDVKIYLEASSLWALNSPAQQSMCELQRKNGLILLKTGNRTQDILGKSGDDVRIDWGYFYLAGNDDEKTTAAYGDDNLRITFCEKGVLPDIAPKPAITNALALCKELGKVDRMKSGYFMIGYDDIYSIDYYGTKLRPYWNREGNKTILTVLKQASKEYNKIKKACDNFDKQLLQEATRCGGTKYAELCALAYRQAVSTHKLVESPDRELLFLSKEISSGGAVATVDISFPTAPLFLCYNIELAKGLLNPIFQYCESGRWTQPFVPHDIGLYPIVSQQHSAMVLPVEESANMLILTAAIATMEGDASYAGKHWKMLTQWAEYLLEKGVDPENQRNTDVFAGFSAHNANLSIKAIIALASYGRLADMLGKNDISQKYSGIARSMAQKWMTMADDGGDHYRFAFDQPNTWSQKYNLVWDKVMRMNIFPHEVSEKEVRYYLSQQKQFGLPLDSKHRYSKADWIVWSATLAPNIETFQQFIDPLYAYVNETPHRVPLADWYRTDKPDPAGGFRARAVVGGFYIKIMENRLINKLAATP